MAIDLDTADGQLSTSKSTLYTFNRPGFFRATFVNNGTTDVFVNLFVKPGATSRLVSALNQVMASGERATFGPHILASGDPIEGVAHIASRVDYKIEVVLT